MARRTKRLWTDEEKRTICFQTTAPSVSVVQVARRDDAVVIDDASSPRQHLVDFPAAAGQCDLDLLRVRQGRLKGIVDDLPDRGEVRPRLVAASRTGS